MAAETPICEFGWKAPDFDLEGVDGRRYRLADIAGEKATLVMFLCNHCPYVKAVIDRIIRDVGDLKAHGVGAIGIMSNDTEAYPDDSFDNMKRLAAEKAYPFPYVIDPTQEVARAYNAVCTPDFFGFDANFGLQYRGRLDASRRETGPSDARRELFEAMVAIAEGKHGPEEQIPSMGCSIKWRSHP